MWQRLYSTWRLGGHPVGDDAGRERAGRRPGNPPGEEEVEPIRSAEGEVVPEHLLEARPAPERPVEHLGLADFHLEEREPVPEARGPILHGERERQVGEPAIEERLDVSRGQALPDGLEGTGVGAREEAVIPGDIGKPTPGTLPLDPLMAVQAALHLVGGIAADLEESWAPLGVEDGEGVAVHVNRHPARGEVDVGPADLLPGGPRLGLLLGDPYAHSARPSLDAIPNPLDDLVLRLTLLKLDPGGCAGRGAKPGASP